MPRLLIKCPECKAIVETGFNVDLASFCTSEFENNKTRCKTCKTEFAWDKDDVLAISFCQ